MTMNSGNISSLIVDAGALLAQSNNQSGVTTTAEFLKTTASNSQPSQSSETRIQQQQQQPQPQTSDAQQRLQNFWTKQMEEIQNISSSEFKTQELPLARIKKIMKMDEDVKMISAEAPLLFSKAAQMFITELSLRAWIHTEDSKRRTLQRNDIANAITKFDQFDFLIDIVPREDLKPKSVSGSEGVQYFYTLPQQARSAATGNNAAPSTNQGPVQMSSLQTGQILLAQQNQNGQPMTLTPVDSNQLMQLAQPAAQQSQQQVPSTIVLNTSPEGGAQVLQKQVSVSNSSNDPKQQQSAQALLQQLVSNLPQTGGNEVHSIQINSQGQLHLVKVANPQNPSQTTVTAESVGHDSQRLISESDTNEMYELAAGIASSARGTDGTTASDATHDIDEMYAKITENT